MGIHNGGCNVAWVDGHVKWMKNDQWYYNTEPDGSVHGFATSRNADL
jgi:prepilin-type processing-associated H-X9-DG protein